MGFKGHDHGVDHDDGANDALKQRMINDPKHLRSFKLLLKASVHIEGVVCRLDLGDRRSSSMQKSIKNNARKNKLRCLP